MVKSVKPRPGDEANKQTNSGPQSLPALHLGCGARLTRPGSTPLKHGHLLILAPIPPSRPLVIYVSQIQSPCANPSLWCGHEVAIILIKSQRNSCGREPPISHGSFRTLKILKITHHRLHEQAGGFWNSMSISSFQRFQNFLSGATSNWKSNLRCWAYDCLFSSHNEVGWFKIPNLCCVQYLEWF